MRKFRVLLKMLGTCRVSCSEVSVVSYRLPQQSHLVCLSVCTSCAAWNINIYDPQKSRRRMLPCRKWAQRVGYQSTQREKRERYGQQTVPGCVGTYTIQELCDGVNSNTQNVEKTTEQAQIIARILNREPRRAQRMLPLHLYSIALIYYTSYVKLAYKEGPPQHRKAAWPT